MKNIIRIRSSNLPVSLKLGKEGLTLILRSDGQPHYSWRTPTLVAWKKPKKKLNAVYTCVSLQVLVCSVLGGAVCERSSTNCFWWHTGGKAKTWATNWSELPRCKRHWTWSCQVQSSGYCFVSVRDSVCAYFKSTNINSSLVWCFISSNLTLFGAVVIAIPLFFCHH